MKKLVTVFILTMAIAVLGIADVVRLAPDFSWQGAGSKLSTLRSLRGQPVVLLVSKSAHERTFRKQASRLKEIYQEFASRNVVFVAAFVDEEGVVPSDVPFVIANNGAKIAADYQVQGAFSVIVIGTDGNVDMQTTQVVPASRIKDVIVNAFPVQSEERGRKKFGP